MVAAASAAFAAAQPGGTAAPSRRQASGPNGTETLKRIGPSASLSAWTGWACTKPRRSEETSTRWSSRWCVTRRSCARRGVDEAHACPARSSGSLQCEICASISPPVAQTMSARTRPALPHGSRCCTTLLRQLIWRQATAKRARRRSAGLARSRL
eukprot:scaffold16017_cov63-Phaeocystis_antarctica.AAC.1